ncbi:FhaA domain-containing protein [Solicola sp. PLA-1-18]
MLQRFEQRLENVVTGAFARAFRSAVQPVEIAAALQREIDNHAQVLSRGRMLVPNDFTVELSPGDHDRLAPYGQTLEGELGNLVREHVTEQSYTLAGPLRIGFEQHDDLGTGRFRIRSQANAVVTPVAGQRMTETAVHRAPVVLEVNGVRHPLSPPGVVLGRGSEAELRINDPGVSRRHAQIKVTVTSQDVSVSVLDLGSTNGTVVDGQRVDGESPLRDGSQILLGNTTLTVRNPHAARSGGL